MQNKDDKCTAYNIARALNPVKRDIANKDPGRITKLLREQTKKLNFTGVEFPVALDPHTYKTRTMI